MIVTIPRNVSSTIREIRATERDGNYADVEFYFVRGGGEWHAFVIAEDLNAVLEAKSIGKAYWRVFRKKYKAPVKIEDPPLCHAWVPADPGGALTPAECLNVMPCDAHQ